MQLPVEISYRGVEKSDEIDDLIRNKAARLDRFCDHISRCDIAVEQPNQQQRSGNPFRVRIDLTVPPGHELVADEKQTEHEMHEPLTKIINDAFKTMERQLKDLVERQRHEVKAHTEPRALITKLFADYGFITDGGAWTFTFIGMRLSGWRSNSSRLALKCGSISRTARWGHRRVPFTS
ncbi:MAG: ribosome-associated translation inhibitor RaiA [Chthoniobacterales bacterium]|nr:ribosome-associated translation inhibitor RaiA [Chthoniobacterales bacterium]